MPKTKKILFLTGSPNQTTQMHKIASELTGYDCYFSQVFDDALVVRLLLKTPLMDKIVLSDPFRRKAEEYLKQHNQKIDYKGENYGHKYDLVVMCSDVVFPKRFKNTKTIFVQEGMTDPFNSWSKIVKMLGLPGFMTLSTSLNGSMNLADVYCVASDGYKERFSKLGTDKNKIITTGMPNFDNMFSYVNNDFPLTNYVLVCTSDIRECYGIDYRKKFIKRCVDIAKGRQIIFKLHPNEVMERAVSEIKECAPADALIYTTGNSNHMVANCDVLITQYSTLTYVGLELGKEVHSFFDVEELKRLAPLQNGATSAKKIADVCKNYVEYTGDSRYFIENYQNPLFDTRIVRPTKTVSAVPL